MLLTERFAGLLMSGGLSLFAFFFAKMALKHGCHVRQGIDGWPEDIDKHFLSTSMGALKLQRNFIKLHADFTKI